MADKHAFFILGIITLIILAPIITSPYPYFIGSPDVQYVKAKIIAVTEYGLFEDPVTGIPNFHPPFFHILLAPFVLMGLPIDAVLIGVTAINVTLSLFFAFLLVRRLFNNRTAVLVCALFPFLFDFMGSGNMFLPTAFYSSIPLYLAGLWLFAHPDRARRHILGYGACWGLAFLMSPMYLFLIGLTFAYDGIIDRKWKDTLLALAIFLFTQILFFYQAYIILSRHLFGTTAFAFWRGLPGIDFLLGLIVSAANPMERAISHPLLWCAVVLLILGAVATRFVKVHRKYVVIGAIAFVLTYYHYMPQYAIRILLLMSIVLVAGAIEFLFTLKWKKAVTIGGILLIAAGGVVSHYEGILSVYSVQDTKTIEIRAASDGMTAFCTQRLVPGEMVLASSLTYRYFILPEFPVHGLLAYKSGEYFQVPAEKSAQLLSDYNRLMQCTTQACLNELCAKYDIHTAIFRPQDLSQFPVFTVIRNSWPIIYSDQYFMVCRRN